MSIIEVYSKYRLYNFIGRLMLSIVYRITLGTGILLIMPVLVEMSGWRWRLISDTWWLHCLLCITKTVTQPWGVIIHIFFCIWFAKCLRLRFYMYIILCIILTCSIVAGQITKWWIKEYMRELRPFVIWMETTHHIYLNKFCKQSCQIRTQKVKDQLNQQKNIPDFLNRYWQQETTLSFPSGHTIFTTSWSLLSVSLLWNCHSTFTIITSMIWTIAVMSSRLLLGMHWPHDLIIAILISWLLILLTSLLIYYIRKVLSIYAHNTI